jgi:hypothetical protein
MPPYERIELLTQANSLGPPTSIATQLERFVHDAAIVDVFAGHFLFTLNFLALHRLGLNSPFNIDYPRFRDCGLFCGSLCDLALRPNLALC